tara:strand:+ start:1899 stop:2564 length:666 start_codon:yes stop_codon:yes gene_type:complete
MQLYPFYKTNNKKLKFIHITKCAGSAIETAGIKNNLKWGKYDTMYKYQNEENVPNNEKIFPPAQWHSVFKNICKNHRKNHNWFMVIRNPYERILSEYYCKWGGNEKIRQMNSKKKMNKFLIEQITNRNKYGCHYTEQYRYTFNDDNNSTLHVLKFENLNKEFYQLMDLYSIENVILKSENQAKSTAQRFTVNDFSKNLIRLINEVYDKDFIIFGYKKMYVN